MFTFMENLFIKHPVLAHAWTVITFIKRAYQRAVRVDIQILWVDGCGRRSVLLDFCCLASGVRLYLWMRVRFIPESGHFFLHSLWVLNMTNDKKLSTSCSPTTSSNCHKRVRQSKRKPAKECFFFFISTLTDHWVNLVPVYYVIQCELVRCNGPNGNCEAAWWGISSLAVTTSTNG